MQRGNRKPAADVTECRVLRAIARLKEKRPVCEERGKTIARPERIAAAIESPAKGLPS
jgi:hypothetical protein